MLDFQYLGMLLHPIAIFFLWLPITGFLATAIGVWKHDRVYHQATFRWRERRRLATPGIVVLEMLLLNQWEAAHPQSGVAFLGVCCLFLALFPLTAYLVWCYRNCWRFTLNLCLAALWLAIGIMILSLTAMIHF